MRAMCNARAARDDEHAYDAWIYGGGKLVVFARDHALPLAWDHDGADGMDLDEIAAVPA